ncbi:MAG: hypothetical protein LDL25_02530 [Hyphomicrobiales bacterium]|uniref:hypothetical protein n=1 Tax=Rhabdaerophilum calidifontis TaxID=2604328 RepID=UPI00123A0DD0|nr:hypothetical protein [Rhabdaerophilum calidifontis]MCA1952708.1 hypothetical protein [Hyphomicrobiales bacterium]MCA1998641.1 hypothetical protein [Hyphomicrobiales bacterium]
MDDRIRAHAHVSVMRGCGFGVIAIITTMIGVADRLALSLKVGGIGMLLMTFILLLKAARAGETRFRSTEVWIMLDEHERPPEALAPGLIARARREAFLRYAWFSAIAAGLMLAGAALAMLLS